jgi:hypothetical protein
VSTQDFFFALEFSSQGVSADLLAELAAHVLNHVGSGDAAVPELAAALKTAVEKGTAIGMHRCDIQFRGSPNKLDILVTSNGGRIWQTSIAVPDL